MRPNGDANYRPEIDGLRALAVVSVIVYHLNGALIPSGYLGVDIFFVISGFVITTSFARLDDVNVRDAAIEFYSRRFKRILPALFVCIIATSAVGALLIPEPKESLYAAAYAVMGLSNLYFLKESKDYFGALSDLNFFTHTWSLGVEEQFYFLFPTIFFFARFKSNPTENTLAAFVVLSVLSFGLFVWLNVSEPASAFYLMPSRFWELGSGCALALAMRGGKRIALISNISPGFLLGLLIILIYSPPDYRTLTTFGVVAATTLLICNLDRVSWSRKLLSQRAIVAVGLLSYSLYLWHWSVLAISRWTIGVSAWTAPFQLIAIFSLAALSYFYVEQPFRHADWATTKTRTIAKGLLASVVCALLFLTLAGPVRKILPARDRAWAEMDSAIREMPCNLPQVAEPIKACLSRKNDEPHIFVVGDSHASQIVASLSSAADAFGYHVVALGDRALVYDIFGSSGCGGTVCNEHELTARLEHFGRELKSNDLVIFSMARDRLYPDVKFLGESRRGNENSTRQAMLLDALRRMTHAINETGARFAVVDDIPKLCSREHFKVAVLTERLIDCEIEEVISLDDRLPLSATYRKLESIGALYVDPHKELCSGHICKSLKDGKPLYSDGSPHFSNYHPKPLPVFFEGWFERFLVRQ